MFLLKLGSELQNLIKKFQPIPKIQKKYRLHFHEVECTGGKGGGRGKKAPYQFFARTFYKRRN